MENKQALDLGKLQNHECRGSMLIPGLFQIDPGVEILAARIAQREADAFEIIYDRFASRVFNLAAMLSDWA